MSAKGNVPVLTDGGTHHSWCWNEKNMVWRTHTTAPDLVSGDVVVKSIVLFGFAESMETTTTQADTGVIGVIPQVEAAVGTIADQTIPVGTYGYVQFAGDISKVNVVGDVMTGDFLITSTTPGRAKSCGTTWQPGVFAIATSWVTGPGNFFVSARLFPVHSQVAPWKPGDVKAHAGRTLETGWLWCDGSQVSRTTYAALFARLCEPVGTATLTIASPCVVNCSAHGFIAGDSFYFTTTGALPTGVAANTLYYVVAAGLNANQFQFSTARGGAAVNSSGSQSGTHTVTACPWGLGNGSTTFNTPDLRGRTLVGAGTVLALGQTDATGEPSRSPVHAHSAYSGGPSGTEGEPESPSEKFVADALHTHGIVVNSSAPSYGVVRYVIKT